MIDGISSSSYRDRWALNDLFNSEKDESVEGTDTATQVWNAVFTDEKSTGVTADDFLSLMVAQLKNQDFMNPVDDTQYVTQLAQFSTMQQMSDMANYMKTSYVMSLVGKNVTAAKLTGASGTLQKETGPVQKISLVNNEFAIYVNDKKFTLEQIMEIDGSDTTSSTTTGGSSTAANDEARKNYLLSLAGKKVTVEEKLEDTGDDTVTMRIEGVVEKVSTENGVYRVYIDGAWHALDDVVEVGTQATEA